MNEKRRPDNGPGANGLRGGVHTYSLKVQTGNWVENYGGPADYKRGFSTIDFETEGQHAQKGALLKGPAEFGAGLPLPQHLTRKQPCAADSFVAMEYIDQRSTMQRTNAEFVALKEKNEQYKPKATLTREQLETYRKNWTTESEIGRKVRYVTESRLAGNMANSKFQMSCIRYLPGTPKSLEHYRERVIEKYGILGLPALRCFVGVDTMPERELRERLQGADVEIKGFEFDQIMAFMTVNSDEAVGADFLRVIKGSSSGHDAGPAKLVFAQAGPVDGVCSLDSVLEEMSKIVQFDEVMKGVTDFIQGYASDNSITEKQFLDLHSDLYASSPGAYASIFT